MFDINVTVTLVSYIKSEISDLKIPFKERVEENHYV